MNILTPQRLQRLSTWEHLGDSWFLVATATLTVCNCPQEIPRLYHYAMHAAAAASSAQSAPPAAPIPPAPQLDAILAKFADVRATGTDATFDPYAGAGSAARRRCLVLTEKLRESILKTAALSGLPRAINALTLLRDSTPAGLRQECAAGGTKRPPVASWADYVAEQQRGQAYWDRVYTKISTRVAGQLTSAYPDLWAYTLQHVYAPLLSYTDVLSADETALVVVASLVPQDVNPQLKGHLRGAVNGGVAVERVRAARDMAIEVGGWCGAVWRGPVAQV